MVSGQIVPVSLIVHQIVLVVVTQELVHADYHVHAPLLIVLVALDTLELAE